MTVVTDPALMDLDNMRSLGIHAIDLACDCGQRGEANADRFPGSAKVGELMRFFRCSECGKRPKSARPGKLPTTAIDAEQRPLLVERQPFYVPGSHAPLR